jgi:hypothetical protein
MFSVVKNNCRGLAISALLVLTALAAFATLGDRNSKSRINRSKQPLLSNKVASAPGFFSLRSGYSYRGSKVFSESGKYININSVVSYQKGNITYVIPLKKKVLLNKVTFNHNLTGQIY